MDSFFSPWNDRLVPQPSEPDMGVSQGPNGKRCPAVLRPFQPSLVAGMSNATAGAYSNFHLKLDREDGDQFLNQLGFKMPPGFTGYLRGIGYCPEASIAQAAQNLGRTELAQPSCPASSRVGTTSVAAGPGTPPSTRWGRCTPGPLNGHPLSLAAITPARPQPLSVPGHGTG